MTTEHDSHCEETIFSTALPCAPEERSAFLDKSCAGQPELRQRVEALLQAQPQLADFMESPLRPPRGSGPQIPPPITLVIEAWLRLGGEDESTGENRTQFFCAAAAAVRRIRMDRARSQQTRRHGGGQEGVHVDQLEIVDQVKDDELLAVNDVLDEFAQHAPQKAELVKLRYYGGMGLMEAGQVLEISEPTAVRWWTYTKTWLYQAIQENRSLCKDSPQRSPRSATNSSGFPYPSTDDCF